MDDRNATPLSCLQVRERELAVFQRCQMFLRVSTTDMEVSTRRSDSADYLVSWDSSADVASRRDAERPKPALPQFLPNRSA